MKPTKVSMSCDANPFYLEFWEPISRIWRKLGVEPHLFFVGESNLAPTDGHGPVTVVTPVDGVPIHTQAQWSRFYFTRTEPDSVWITSDIDMFPLSRAYFVDLIEGLPDDCWASLNSDMGSWFPVCYNVAKGQTFIEVLDFMDNFADDVRRVYENSFKAGPFDHKPSGQDTIFNHWGADEYYISGALTDFRAKHPRRMVQCVRPGGRQSARRVDRDYWPYDEQKAMDGYYLDFHSLRPYGKHKEEIEKLLKIVFK